MLQFDAETSALKHNHCHFCKSTSITLKMYPYKKHGEDCCARCERNKPWTYDYAKTLPVWYLNNVPQFHVPVELSCLSEGEKLLIQQASCYVPLVYLKHGNVGNDGHVCSFPVDIGDICVILPRLPADCQFVKVVKKYIAKDTKELCSTNFTVRREAVLTALRWLQRYNKAYKHITIAESNLNWMDGKAEAELPCNMEDNLDSEMEVEEDLGPAPSQVADVAGRPESVMGMMPKSFEHLPKQKDNDVTVTIDQATKKGSKPGVPVVTFPYAAKEALSEYDADQRLFVKAFPWLFPGGIGDYHDHQQHQLTVNEWMQRCALYVDGRFAMDKMWGFYALNWATRKKNQTSGGYFVDKFFCEGPASLDALKKEIEDGDMTWVNKISYYSQRVVGSPAFWRAKRNEVYTWINYHIDKKHGPPTFFITLSCAEYFWPDVERLVKERFTGVGLEPPDLEKARAKVVNDCTIVVQELFQERIKIWMRTVGKEIFGIEYHWLRFEFAPGRGQIHAHILAISNHKSIQRKYYDTRHDKSQQAILLQQYMEARLDMTASAPAGAKKCRFEDHPAKKSYSHVTDVEQDRADMIGWCEMHKCSAFCMRSKKLK
jgi:hypothetical protein